MKLTTRFGFAPVGAVVIPLLVGMLATACGSKDDDYAASAASATRTPAAPAPPPVDPERAALDARMAAAVVDGKTSAPVDLRYDVLSKPDVGQPFEVELALQPRISADSLDVEIGDSPGLAIDGERAARFPTVEAGKSYPFKVQVRGATAGLYYISVIAKVSTAVQTESRAFTIPVVIGSPVAASQKPEQPKDASGQPVQSMPAKEN